MRDDAGRGERAPRIFRRQADPQVRVLRAEREATEKAGADEVPPAAEHRRDLHPRPPTDGLVEQCGGPRPAALQVAAGLAAGPHATDPPARGPSHGTVAPTSGELIAADVKMHTVGRL